ncbi:MAG: hypothetical protein GXP18_05510, partial [Gammaproteobacteria bacterium]|nr:hypothetical protein [Gammaproteobacteria bacterium]
MNDTTDFKCIVLFAAILALTACGGGGGGESTPLPVDTYTKTVELPDTASPWNELFSDNSLTGAHYQGLVLAQDIKGSGPLTKLSFRFATGSTGNSCPNVTIRMGHTSVTDLDITYANNAEQGSGSFMTVFDDTTLNIPGGNTGDYFTIPLNDTFSYNGVDNLVVDIISGTCTGNSDLAASTATALYAALIRSPDSATLTGNTGNTLAHMQFTFAGGDNSVDPGVGTLPSLGNSYPFNADGTGIGRKVQLLYSASDINGDGLITGIGFPVGELTTEQTFTVTVKLGHSTRSALVDGTFANNYSDTPVTVGSDLTFTVPAGIVRGDFVWLPVTGSFTYNGINNLILEVETTNNNLASDQTKWWFRSGTGTNNRLFGNLGAETGTASDDYYFAKFRFEGGTIDAGLSGTTSLPQVFDNTPDGATTQSLYRPVDLGTGGMIESIAVRLVNDSIATTHNNYTIRMGHTDKTSLDINDTFASNMDEDMTVFSGSYAVPAGLKAGDWVTIPLDTGFNYDSTRN